MKLPPLPTVRALARELRALHAHSSTHPDVGGEYVALLKRYDPERLGHRWLACIPTECDVVYGREFVPGSGPFRVGTKVRVPCGRVTAVHSCGNVEVLLTGVIHSVDATVHVRDFKAVREYHAARATPAEPRCQCGSGVHVRSAAHTDWCQLYDGSRT